MALQDPLREVPPLVQVVEDKQILSKSFTRLNYDYFSNDESRTQLSTACVLNVRFHRTLSLYNVSSIQL